MTTIYGNWLFTGTHSIANESSFIAVFFVSFSRTRLYRRSSNSIFEWGEVHPYTAQKYPLLQSHRNFKADLDQSKLKASKQTRIEGIFGTFLIVPKTVKTTFFSYLGRILLTPARYCVNTVEDKKMAQTFLKATSKVQT